MTQAKQATGARMRARLGVATAAAALWLVTIGGAEAQYTRYMPAAPEPGTELPQATVNFGMRPYADNTFYVIAMKKGWFAEAGIKIGPEELGMKINDTNGSALLLNGQLDIASQYCPLMLPTYKTAEKLKCIAFTDTFLGMAIMAKPELKLKSFRDYIKEGKDFDGAIKAALAPLEGKTLITPPQLSDRPFTDAAAAFSGVKWKTQVLEDSKSLVLAKSGQIDFLNPEGAPVVYTLMQAGWTRVLGIGDLFEYAPGGAGSPVAPLVAIVGIGANADYVNKNPNTVLRFLSVVWRTIDAVRKDGTLFDLQAPYLNSVAGTSLDGAGVKATVDTLHPFASFDYGKTYFEDQNNVLYYGNAWGAMIKEFVKNKVIPDTGLAPDDIVWAAAIWKQMEDYRQKSEKLLADLGNAKLADHKKALYEQAKSYYDKFNYLDAFRLATAARS
jgi:ABC-type nitrate/sulfonate/bicarbonate transport system substrate-binding protein